MALAKARSGSNSLGRAISGLSSLHLGEIDRPHSRLYSLESTKRAGNRSLRGKDRYVRTEINEGRSEITNRSIPRLALGGDRCSNEPNQVRPRHDRIPIRRRRWHQDSLPHSRPRACRNPAPWLHPNLADVEAVDSEARG